MSKTLIIKMWALGDIVMATPMLNAIKTADPEHQVVWLVDKSHAEVVLRHPLIDEVVVMDTVEWRKLLKKGDLAGWTKTALEMMRTLRRKRFDSVINCHPEKWWTLLFCQAHRRVGLFPSSAHRLWRVLYADVIERPTLPRVHNTVHYLLATRALGFPDSSLKMSVAASPSADKFVGALLAEASFDDELPIVLLAPFSTARNRNWPAEGYAELALWLIESGQAQVVLTGASSDIDELDKIASNFPKGKCLVARNTTISQYVALIKKSSVVVSGDSSAMHLAAATDVPFVALFGATPKDERAPLAGEGSVLSRHLSCAPCDRPTCTNPEFRRCMTLIDAADVLQAVAGFLQQRNG